MIVINGFSKLDRKFRNPVVAVGVFDGVHRGHQRLIREAVARAKKIKGTAMVLTFRPHPVHVLRPEIYLPLIIPFFYRLRLFQEMGMQACVVAHFTKRFAGLSPERFIREYLVKRIAPAEVIVGDDFRFGQDRAGLLDGFRSAGERYGFVVRALKALRGGKKSIGSTRIRQLIADGRLPAAARLLGRPVSLLGLVVRGDTRGQTLGYPTANINPPQAVVLPPGVFIVRVRLGRKVYQGIANVGQRPSFKRAARVNVEVHFFDFKGDIYGREITVDFLRKIRDERPFWTQEELVRQIAKDEQKARAWFSSRAG